MASPSTPPRAKLTIPSMSLLTPLGLLALLALPVIIILHLWRARRKRVVVASLLFWQQFAQRERRRRFPLSLLLLLHLLAAALLGLALAQPVWASGLFTKPRHTAIIIDTSTSMAAPVAGGARTRLDVARDQVRQLVGQEQLTLISAGPRPALLAQADRESTTNLLLALDALRAAGSGSDLAAAMTLAETLLQGEPDARLLVLSDTALPLPQIAQLQARTSRLPTTWQTIGGVLDNRAIVTLSARPRSGGPIQIYARLVNYGSTTVRTVVRLSGDGRLLDTRPVTLRPAGEVELTWSVPREIALLRAELDGSDSLPIDDTAMLNLQQLRPIRALLVSAQPALLERALSALPRVALNTVSPARYPTLAGNLTADLTIFDGYLPTSLPTGALLIINPPPGSALPPGVRSTSTTRLLDSLSLDGVDFGAASAFEPPDWATTLLARAGEALILRGRVATSELAIWNFDLARSNLSTRLAFPLLVARTVADLTPPELPGSLLLGEEMTLQPDPRATQVLVTAPNGSQQQLSLDSPQLNPLQPGVYTVTEQDAGGVILRWSLAVNAGSPIESNLVPQVAPSFTPPVIMAEQRERYSALQLWPWLTGLVIGVILIEWIAIHWRRSPNKAGS